MIHLSYDTVTNIESVNKNTPDLEQDEVVVEPVIDVLQSPLLKDSSTEKIFVSSPQQIEWIRQEILLLKAK